MKVLATMLITMFLSSCRLQVMNKGDIDINSNISTKVLKSYNTKVEKIVEEQDLSIILMSQHGKVWRTDWGYQAESKYEFPFLGLLLTRDQNANYSSNGNILEYRDYESIFYGILYSRQNHQFIKSDQQISCSSHLLGTIKYYSNNNKLTEVRLLDFPIYKK